jgi:ketosteroid isomerase-like protein
MGAAGGMEKGIDQIRPRVNLLTQRRKEASGFAENRAVIEYLAIYTSGDLAYTVQIERRQLASKEQQPRRDNNLRATHVLRRENGVWKLLHRQADPLVDVTIPELAPGK